jgi:hypothetical protein
MKRTSLAALTLLASFATLGGPGCSSDATPDPTPSAGTAAAIAGTSSVLPIAGTSSTTPTAGTPAVGGTASSGGAGTGGSSAGATTAGTAAGGTASGGAASGGSTAGGAATAGTAAGGTASAGTASGGAANPGCPAKIDSSVACTAVVSCPAATCGAFKLGAKDCNCAAASGTFMCSSCSYAGKTESIVQTPAAALPACASDDTTLEKNTTGCTKGDRCKSLDTAKVRFCACWDDPVKATTVWDCDAMPSAWPM